MTTNINQLFAFMQSEYTSGGSIYEVWKNLGHHGGYAEFLEFMRTGTKGDSGQDGMSAYDVWKTVEGNENKTLDDFIVAITGPAGESPYDIWLGLGYEGDANAFLEFLKGEPGKTGESVFETWRKLSGNEDGTAQEFIDDLRMDIDEELSLSSKNAVENKVVTAEFEKVKNDTKELVNSITNISVDNTLYNSKESNIRLLEMTGNTEQKTVNGYQLFDASKLPTTSIGGATVTNNGDGSFTVSGEGVLSSVFNVSHSYTHEETVKLLKAGNMYQICEARTMPSCYTRFSNSSGFVGGVENGSGVKTSFEITQEMLNDESFVMRISFYSDVNKTIIPGTIKPMVYQDGDGIWEEFVGGTQSPSPEYPQAICNVGDCVEMESGGYSTDNGNPITNAQTLRNKYKIPCKNGDIIVVDNEVMPNISVVHYYDENGNFISYKMHTYTTNKMEVAVNVNNACYFNFHNLFNGLNKVSKAGKISLTVNGKYVMQIREVGKNLIPYPYFNGYTKTINGITFTTNKDGSITVNGTATDTATFTLVNKTQFGVLSLGEDYILNGCPASGGLDSFALSIESHDYKQMRADSGDGASFTASYNEYYIFIRVYKGATVSNKTFHPMIRKADITDSTYEPYQEQITTIYTNEPIRKGDVLEYVDGQWRVERNVAETVFDGRETILIANANQYYIDLDTNAYSNSFQPCYCSHFIASRKGAYNAVANNLTSVASTRIWIYSTSFKTNTDLNAYFAEQYANGTPVIVQHELATPTYEILDETSQLALNNLKSFNDITYINIDSRVKPLSIKTQYATNDTSVLALNNSSELFETNIKLENHIEENEEKFVELENEVIELRDNDVVTTNEYAMKDSKSGKLNLVELAGNTEQKTLSGYQLFNKNTDVIENYYVDSNGAVIYNADTKSIIKEVKPLTTYTFSKVLTSRFRLAEFTEKPTQGMTGTVIRYANNTTEYTFTTSETVKYIMIYLYYSVEDTSITFDSVLNSVLLTEGDTVLSYEPYCGGTPSPNPDYPQAICNTGDCVEMTQGAYLTNNGAYIGSVEHICNRYPIPCKSGDAIKIVTEKSYQSRVLYYNSNGYISYETKTGNIVEYTVPNNVEYFNFRFGESGINITPSIVGKITLTVNGKHITQIATCGKNLVYEKLAGYTIDTNGSLTDNSLYDMHFAKVKEGATYTITTNDTSRCVYGLYTVMPSTSVFSYNKSRTIQSNNTLTIPTGCNYIGFRSLTGYSTPQIELGSIITPYEPYKEHVSTIYTDEPIRKGDVIKKIDNVWQVERNIKVGTILDNNAILSKELNRDYLYYIRYSNLENVKTTGLLNQILINGLSYKSIANLVGNSKDNIGFSYSSSDKVLYINVGYYLSEDTYEAMREWFSNNIMEYQALMETPTYEILDDTSQSALNNLKSFNNITYIDIDSRVKPSSIITQYGITNAASLALKHENDLRELENKLDDHMEEANDRMDKLTDDIVSTNETTLVGTKVGGLRLTELKGNTEQKVVNGYQLFDASKLPTTTMGGATVTNNRDGSFTVSGEGVLSNIYSMSYTIDKEEALRILKIGTLHIAPIKKTYPVFSFGIYDASNNSAYVIVSNNGIYNDFEVNQHILDKINAGEYVVRSYFYGSTDSTITPGTIKPMVYYEGDGTWEEYVGTQPSPNPQYPQSINNVSDCVEVEQGGIRFEYGDLVVMSRRVRSKKYIPCKSGDVITITCEPHIEKMFLFYYNDNDEYIVGTQLDRINTITRTVPDGATKFKFTIGYDEAGTIITPKTVGKISLTINGKYVTQIRIHGGKNLFDINGDVNTNLLKGTTDTKNTVNNNILTVDYNSKNTNGHGQKIYNVKAGDTICMSLNILSIGSSQGLGLRVKDGDEYIKINDSYIKDIGCTSFIYTCKTDNIYVGFVCSEGTGVQIANIQVEKGNECTSYEPYKEKVVTIYTEQPIRSGDVVFKDDESKLWLVERNRGYIIFDSINTPFTYKSVENENKNVGFAFSGYESYFDILPLDAAKTNDLKCSHFICGTTHNSTAMLGKIGISQKSKTIYVWFGANAEIATLELANKWLEDKKIMVDYPLATPTYETLDTQSQLALNSLDTYNSVTNLEVNSRVKPESVSVDYGITSGSALSIKNELRQDSYNIELNELKAAMLMLNQN